MHTYIYIYTHTYIYIYTHTFSSIAIGTSRFVRIASMSTKFTNPSKLIQLNLNFSLIDDMMKRLNYHLIHSYTHSYTHTLITLMYSKRPYL